MFRTSLFLMLASVAGIAAAQTQDPLAAAPVQYDNGPATQQVDYNDNARAPQNVMDCGLDDAGRPQACPDDTAYTPDDEIAPADDAPLFAPDYYAYEDYAYYPPYPYYAGVSLWPAYYWPGYAWGWGGWGWGWGWPSISIGFGWGWHGGWGYHGWGHGWHNGYAWHGGWHGDRFHGPWRYDGHGHYWDHRDYGRSSHFAGRGFNSQSNFTANRNFNTERSFNQNGFNRGFNAQQGARGFNGVQSRSFGANREGVNNFSANRFGANRGTLPSASYYSNARGVSTAQSLNRGNFNRGESVNSNARAMPSFDRGNFNRGETVNRAQFNGNNVARGNAFGNRQYTATMRGSPSSYNNRSYSATMQGTRMSTMPNRSFQTVQRGGFTPQQRSFAGYPGGRAGSYARPSYSGHPGYSGGGRSYSSPHVSAPSHSSGGSRGGGGSDGGHHH